MWSVGLRLIIYLNLKKIDYGWLIGGAGDTIYS